jgi:hypothetical protein
MTNGQSELIASILNPARGLEAPAVAPRGLAAQNVPAANTDPSARA